MAVIDLNTFGGIMPSVNKRDLPGDAAQTANNVDQRFPDLRPSKAIGTSLTTVASAAKSIFRTPKQGTWISSANDVDYVPDMIQDISTSDRIYLSGQSGQTALPNESTQFLDGTQTYPQAWQGGSFRPLGIPAPKYALDDTVNGGTAITFVEGFEFTADDASLFELQTLEKWKGALGNNLTEEYYGFEDANGENARPMLALANGAYLIPHGYPGITGMPTTDTNQWAFAVPGTGSGASFQCTYQTKHGFMTDPALGASVITASGSGSTSPYGVVAAGNYLATPIFARARTFKLSQASFESTVATNIRHPNPTPDAPLIPASTVTGIANGYVAMLNPNTAPRSTMIADLTALVNEGGKFLNSMSDDYITAQMTAFYGAGGKPMLTLDKYADLLADTLYETAVVIWNADVATSDDMPPSAIPRQPPLLEKIE